MLLAPVADILDELGFSDMEDITAAITAALHVADKTLQGMLATTFERQTSVSDTYYVMENGYQLGNSYQNQFRLSCGFVDTVVVKRASSLALLTDDPTTYTSDVVVQADKGVVRDFTTNYERQFVRITYNAGFSADAEDPTYYNLTQVPAWLQEAAKIKAKIALCGNGALEGTATKLDVKSLSAQLNATVVQKLRYTPTALLPL